MKTDRTAHKATAARIERRQELRRSGAAGPHGRHEPRLRTRSAAEGRAVRESLAAEWEALAAARHIG